MLQRHGTTQAYKLKRTHNIHTHMQDKTSCTQTKCLKVDNDIYVYCILYVFVCLLLLDNSGVSTCKCLCVHLYILTNATQNVTKISQKLNTMLGNSKEKTKNFADKNTEVYKWVKNPQRHKYTNTLTRTQTTKYVKP